MQFNSYSIKIAALAMFLILAQEIRAESKNLAQFETEIYQLRITELEKYNGLRIDSVEIDNREIFDTQIEPYNNFIFKTANKLHIRTKTLVIARELLLKKGDVFESELAEEITRNLRNRYVIYDAWIEIEELDSGDLLMRLVTIDEWSFSGGLGISREGNEYSYDIGFLEKNFLGLNQSLSFDYVIQEKDDNYIESSFRDIRFAGQPFRITINYSNNPVSSIQAASLSHPFYNLEQEFSFGVVVAKGHNRNEVFKDNLLIGRSNTADDFLLGFMNYRFGPRKKKVITGLNYTYTFERTNEKEYFSGSPADIDLVNESFPGDSLYHQVDLSLRGSLLDFKTFRKIDGFGYTEDFTLGHTAAIGYGRAFNPRFNDHLYDRALFNYSFGFNIANELFYFSYTRVNKFKGTRDLQRLSIVGANYYHRGPEFLTIALNADYINDWRPEETENLILGGKSGLRGYPSEFKTGDRLAVINLEGRLHPEIRIFTAIMGFAVFMDAGRVWKPNELLTTKDFYFSGGVGLRFALDRSSRSRFFRADLAYSQANKLEISIGTGQFFNLNNHSLFLTSR
ncbi:MAG: hypothetical protein IIA17_00485 [candidate division Zixibacteria bacterium]|nr:hypothetical protein [candidate division Zixibacteria bacterium]